MPAVMPWGETINVGMSVGFLVNIFTLDDPVLGLLDGIGVLDGNLLALDVSSFVQSVSTNRGRNPNQSQVQAGTVSITLNNNDRRFDPINEASPYWDVVLNKSGVQPRRFVEIICDDIHVFQGAISAITIDYIGDYSTCIIEASDDFVRLANMKIQTPLTPAVQISGNRISTILNLAEVDYPADQRSIAIGGSDLQALLIDADTNVMQYLQDCAEADQALLFMSRAGVLTYTDPLGTVWSTDTVAIFTDVAPETGQIQYTNIRTITDQTFLYNKIIVSKEGGATVIADDATSQEEYGISTLSMTGLLLNDQADVTALSTSLLAKYKDPIYRFDDLQFAVNGLSPAERALLSALEIGDNIKIIRTFATGTPLTVALYYQVDRLLHNMTIGSHTVTIGLGDLKTLVFPFILDDPIYGLLDSNNALA